MRVKINKHKPVWWLKKKRYVKYGNIYPKPIVDYKSARKKSIELYSIKN